MLIRGLIKKFCSWPFSKDPEGHHTLNWEGTEKKDFYEHINNRRFFDALQIIRTKSVQHSVEEMGLLMRVFEREVLGGQVIVIEEKKKRGRSKEDNSRPV